MKRKLFYFVMILALIISVPGSVGLSAPTAVTTPHALGTLIPAGPHLVRPRADAVESLLQKEGKLALNADKAAVELAVNAYYDAFDKKSSDWVNPEIEKKILDNEQKLGSGLAPQVDPLPEAVSVKVFALAVQFGATNETVNYCSTSGTFSGPLQGQISAPVAADNNTIFYTPEQTASTDFYTDLIFGYKGVGRIRIDPLRERPTPAELVYRVGPANDGVVFATPERARYVANLHHALDSKTWGEFRSRIPAEEWEQLAEGVAQRATLLNAVLADIYGPQRLLADDWPAGRCHGTSVGSRTVTRGGRRVCARGAARSWSPTLPDPARSRGVCRRGR